MNCKKCGELLKDHMKFCPVCGEKQDTEAFTDETVLNPVHSHEEDCIHEGEVVAAKSVGFVEAVKLYFLRYADFRGRSRRSEYWWASLGIYLLGLVVCLVLDDLSFIWTLLTFVPSLALGVRRLHDIGRGGWWVLINLIPVAGPIIFLIWTCTDSAPDNQWGKNPKY